MVNGQGRGAGHGKGPAIKEYTGDAAAMKHRSIAIDGPSGAGKTTLAKMLADEL